MRNSELFDMLVAEADHPFAGWDFSHITATGRMAEAPLPWSYASTLLMPLRKAQSLLDMGTGGGEFLSFLQPLPPAPPKVTPPTSRSLASASNR